MPNASLQRLHPLSPVFLLLADIRRFIVPLVGLAIFGYYDHTSLWPFSGIGLVMTDSLLKYATCRYGVIGGAIVMKEGLLLRSRRKLPIAKIKKISLHQSALQRAFGVASLSMATAVGQEPEIELSVLKLKDAIAMEALIKEESNDNDRSEPASDELVLAMPLSDVMRLGSISPKSFVVLGSVIVAVFASRPDRYLPAARSLFDDTLARLGGGAVITVLIVALVLVSRIVSIAMALLEYHGFQLSKTGALLTVERGLLTKWRTRVSQNRVQKLTMFEGPMHRLLKRRSVKAVTTEPPGLHRLFRSLAPLAPKTSCESLIDAVFSKSRWLSMTWRSLHQAATFGLFLRSVPLLAVATLAFGWKTGSWILPATVLLAFSAFVAWKRARYAGYAFDGEVIAVRDGYWFRRWRVAQLDRLQALQLSRSPMDRLCGTSTLQLDIPSNQILAPTLSIRFLPESDASWLFHRIGVLLSKKLRQ